MPRVVMHLDMDAFYASVEQRDHPALKGLPVIVGSPPTQRGVVSAASYEARKFGVHSAMPSVTANRLCPQGVFLPPRMDAYQQESRQIMEILNATGARIEQVSIDEAYLELTELISEPDPDMALLEALPMAREIRKRVRQERELTASIGIASNKLLAKIASDFNKPDGLTLIPERDKVAFLRPMPVRVIHGVGKVTEEALHTAGLRTVGDLQDYPGDLRSLAGSFGQRLREFAMGQDDRPLELGDIIKSISAEETYLRDTAERAVLRKSLRSQAEEIAAKLARKRLTAKTVQVKVRYGDFTTLTRQISVEDNVAEAKEIYRLACHLLGRERLVTRPLRLIGLGVSSLTPRTGTQLMFGFDRASNQQTAL